MANPNFFRELAIKKATKQTVVVDKFFEATPFLSSIPVMEASDGLINKYEEISDITAAQSVDIDGVLPTVTSNSELKETQLSTFGGKLFIGKTQARKMGGKNDYFATKFQPVLRQSGMNLEKSLYYNTYRKKAIDAGNVISALGSTASKQNSILAVTFVMGETNGLVDSEMLGRGELFDLYDLYGGDEHENSDGVIGYTRAMESHMGHQIANSRNVATIVNIDLGDDGSGGYLNVPTEKQMNQLIRSVRGTRANTILVTSPDVIDALGAMYKTSHMQMGVMDSNYDNTIDMWKGIPLIGTYNLDIDAEAVIS